MLDRTGPWLLEWLMSVTLEDALLYEGGEDFERDGSCVACVDAR